MNKYKELSNNMYNVPTLKAAKEIGLDVINSVIIDLENKDSYLYKYFEEQYEQTITSNYSVTINNEIIYYSKCPICNTISESKNNVKLKCGCNLMNKTFFSQKFSIILGENMILSGMINLNKKIDDYNLDEYMTNPELYFKKLKDVPLNSRIFDETELFFYTKKHKGLRVLRNNVYIYNKDRYSNSSYNNFYNIYDPMNLLDNIIEKYNKEKQTNFDNLEFIMSDIYNNPPKTSKTVRGKVEVPKEIEEIIIRRTNDFIFNPPSQLYIDDDVNLHLLKSKKVDDKYYVVKSRLTNNNYDTIQLIQSKEDINNIIINSKYKYSGLDIVIDSIFANDKANIGPSGVKDIEAFKEAYNENNKIETILKLPLFKSFNLDLKGVISLKLQDGKKPYQILGVSPAGFKTIELLSTYDNYNYDYSKYTMINQVVAYDNLLKAKGKTMSPDTMNLIGAMFGNQFSNIFTEMYSLLENYNIDERQVFDYVMRVYRVTYENPKNIFNKWKDYLNMANAVGYNLRNQILLFPEDVNVAHGQVLSLYNKVKEEIDEAKIKEILEEAAKKYEYKGKDYSIIAPSSAADIVEEGSVLRHCVKSYVDKVIARSTNIMFLRDNNNLEKPFYTIEIKAGKIIQIRGFSNKLPSATINQFINEFKKEKNLF